MIACKGVGIARFGSIADESIESWIVVIKPSRLGPDPETAIGIRSQRPDVILRK